MSSSSPDDLSTPPETPDIAAPSGTSAANANGRSGSTIRVLGGAAAAPAPAACNKTTTTQTTTAAAAAAATTTKTTTTTTATTLKKRAKKEPASGTAATGEQKPKRAPRSRAPKDPNAPPPQRKKRKITTDAPAATPTPTSTSTSTSVPSHAHAHAHDHKPALPEHYLHPQHHKAPVSRKFDTTNLVSDKPVDPEPVPSPAIAHVAAATTVHNPRPASSGQLYDPIRSSTIPVTHAHSPRPHSMSTRVINRASASPSIRSLIDPPTVTNSTHSAQGYVQPMPPLSITSAPASPAPMQTKLNPFGLPPTNPTHIDGIQQLHQQPLKDQHQPQSQSQSEQQQQQQQCAVQTAVPQKKTGSSESSTAPTPPAPQKSSKLKEAVRPPPPSRSGLLHSVPFAGAVSSKPSTTSGSANGTSIWLTFPLKGQTNVTINFAREVEKKYGFAALHPRLAAARDRRRHIAAATAALEKGSSTASADDMSVDLSEPDSNVEMGGMEVDIAQEGNKKQRKKKAEDYDKDDDFIDDAELAWEQSALMARDGFFVYSGPLITEGEKPTIERSDGTTARGRGRGRGRGGPGRGDAATARGRGAGRGSRGGAAAARKPRVTKADRDKAKSEKATEPLTTKPMAT